MGKAIDYRLSGMAGVGVVPSSKCLGRTFKAIHSRELAPPFGHVSPQFEVDRRATSANACIGTNFNQLLSVWQSGICAAHGRGLPEAV
jgi:hypothetical protein